MPEILALLLCLQPCLTITTVPHLSRITFALLTMTGRVTMLGISRWSGKGASYRTVQRFFATIIPWAQVFILFFRQHLFRTEDVYLLAGDEVVVPKAGKPTFALDRFFSSIYQHPAPGLAFFSLALVSTQDRRAFPVRIEQVVRTERVSWCLFRHKAHVVATSGLSCSNVANYLTLRAVLSPR